MSTRRSPIQTFLSESPAPAVSGHEGAALSHSNDLVKLGVKGKELVRWASENGIELPATVYETRPVGDRGVLARVGSGEIIFECLPQAPELARIEELLRQPWRGIYRVEQQSATYELAGPRARQVLGRTCSMNFEDAGPDRIIFTRVAGVSCGIIPHHRDAGPVYRIWVDYTFAPYLWKTLVNNISGLK